MIIVFCFLRVIELDKDNENMGLRKKNDPAETEDVSAGWNK